MDIIKQIATCAAEYEASTGIKPTRVYLGHGEADALRKLTGNEGSQCLTWPANNDGWSRPVVLGMPCYEVDDDGPHMRCCK
jgi:hypothetical protein